jgi:pantetheine-phosphate adenylyltransferase
MRVALGGTFDPIHDGHRALFERAFELGDVTVGLTSDELASEIRSGEDARPVRRFEERRAVLDDELTAYAREYGREYRIRRLETPTGIATEPRFEALVVSPETAGAGERINERRRERGRDPLEVHVVDHVLAEDGAPIASTRIVRGEIDEQGRLTPEATGREPGGP